MDEPITVRKVRNAIREHEFHHADEVELHTGLEQVLAKLGLTSQREVRLAAQDRIDLMTDLPRPDAKPVRLGIEVKIAGAAGDVRRQLVRYTSREQLDALLLVTAIQRHMIEIMPYAEPCPDDWAGASWMLGGKPFEIALLRRGML